MSRNSEYEARKRNMGFKKITVWVPVEAEDDFKLMAQFTCEHPDHTPMMVRNIKTGRMAKAV
ncbi:hypothetical protein [Pseudoalteromonas sp. T1lg48]|uniref:hypothetical protein n=1 Tax=Pseudoalteromonas sp. T1lg48 TaxID=2077100 RepID=UPI000CF6EA29|nr:hypothetical protein [Pseudoalteromonas sp. T1lg48]